MTAPFFDQNIPQFPSDQLATTQPQFLSNFINLFNAFNLNHVPINETNAGNHTYIRLKEQKIPILTNVSEISIYTKNVENQTDQIFMRYEGGADEFQFTNYQIYTPEQVTDRNQFFTFLPGGILAYFGSYQNLDNKGLLTLTPSIGTKLISVATCPFGTIPDVKVQYVPGQLGNTNFNELGYIESINILTSGLPTGRAPDSYYLIFVNTGVI